MAGLKSGLLMGAVLSMLILSGSAQADTMQTGDKTAPASTKDQIAQQSATATKVSTSATYEIRVPKKGYVRPEGNANPWAGGDTHGELRAFFGEKP
jgi:hypothetical protein